MYCFQEKGNCTYSRRLGRSTSTHTGYKTVWVAAEKNGGRSIGFSEIDKPAIAVYEKNFRTSKETAFGDITQLKKLPYADVYFGGVPCQSWSIAGSKKGFDDPRGKLWEDTIRVTRLNKPRVFVYENVKGLYDPRNRDNLDLLLREFKKAGYRSLKI